MLVRSWSSWDAHTLTSLKQPLWRTLAISYKIFSIHRVTPLPGVYPNKGETYVHKKGCVGMCTTALF